MTEIIAISVLILIIIVNIIIYKCLNKKYQEMSFQESFDLVGLPVITFKQKNNKFNFLLDTGANKSIINSEIVSSFQHKNSSIADASCFGMEGNKIQTSYINADVSYKGNTFNEDFQVIDMSAAFNNVKSEYGVTIHGILGSGFMNKYQYVLDFETLIAYSKKV